MLHDYFRAARFFSRWKVRPSFGESATTYFASLVFDSEDCSPRTFAMRSGLLSAPNPSLPILEAVLRLPLTDEEKANLVKWTPMLSPLDQSWTLCGHRIPKKRFAEIGRFCTECIKEASFHRVWCDLQGFMICPVHDTPLTKSRKQGYNDHPRFTHHGTATNKISSPPILSQSGRESYEGYLLQTLGAVGTFRLCPLLDGQPLASRIRVVERVGRLLSNPKNLERRNPPLHTSSMAKGFYALKHDVGHLENEFSAWLLSNHSGETFRRMTLGHYGYFRHMTLMRDPLKDTVVAAAIAACARLGALTPRLRMKPGVNVPLHLNGLAKKASLTRYSLMALLRHHWQGIPPETEITEVPFDVADLVMDTVKNIVPLAQAAKVLGCSPKNIRALFRMFSLEGEIVAVAKRSGRQGHLHLIESHLDEMLKTLQALPSAPPTMKTVSVNIYAKRLQVSVSRVFFEVIRGQREAFQGARPGLDSMQFHRPPRAAWGGKPAAVGRKRTPFEGMLFCEFYGMTGADPAVTKELIKAGFIQSYTDKPALIDRASALAFHRRYVNPVQYMMGRNMTAADAMWAVKRMGLPPVFRHGRFGPSFLEQTEMEARIGGLNRPLDQNLDLWRLMIRYGAANAPSLIIPELPGDGPSFIYTSSRMFSFRVIFTGQGLRLKVTFKASSRRIWAIYKNNLDVFRDILGSFIWEEDGDGVIASTLVTRNSEVLRAIVELGGLAPYFRYKKP